jgi:hypothetical protein
MIDPATTQKELDQLANTLAKNGDPIAASRIRQLIIAIGGDPIAEDWAATNIQQVIDPVAITEGIKSNSTPHPIIGFLEWLRNGLVLLPLTLTWLGISQAALRYQQVVNADKSQEQHSFLFLWQTGFKNTLWPGFVLDRLALADFVLLGIIFLLTLITTHQQSTSNLQEEKMAERLRTNLSHALGDASLCLAHIHRQNQARQPSNLADISRYLYQFGEDFKKTTDQFVQELEAERKNRGDLTTFMSALDAMSKNMLAAANSIQLTNTNLTTTLQEILVPVKTIPGLVSSATLAVTELSAMSSSLKLLVSDQNKWRQELQTVLDNNLKQLLSEQKLTSQDLKNILTSNFQQLLSNEKQASQDLHSMLSALITQQIGEQTRIGQELYTLQDTSFTQLLAEQQKLGVSLNDAANELENSSLTLGQAFQNFSKTATEQTQLLNGLHSMQNEQRQLTIEMTTATAEIKNVLKSVREASPELRSMAVDIDRFVQALRAIPAALNADLLAPLHQYSSAASKINGSADMFIKAIQYFEYVIEKLDKRFNP